MKTTTTNQYIFNFSDCPTQTEEQVYATIKLLKKMIDNDVFIQSTFYGYKITFEIEYLLTKDIFDVLQKELEEKVKKAISMAMT